MAIISKSFNKKLAKARRWSNFWFKLFKLRFMRKILKKILKQTMMKNNLNNIEQLQVFPSDFRKLSDEQIERGLNMFVERRELASWNQIKVENADGYLLVFPDENRSQSRILNRIPGEIDINNIKLEPITQNAENTSSEQPAKELTPTTQPETVNPEQTKQHAKPTNNDDEDISKPF